MGKAPAIKKKAAILKRLGVVNYDLRKRLHPSSKKRIDRLYDEWSYTINNEDLMVRRRVGEKTAALFRKSGYSVNERNQVFLMQEPGDRVQIKDGFVIYHRGSGDTETIVLSGRADFLEQLERMKDRELRRNELLTLKIGEFRNISSQFTSWQDLHKYANNTQWKSPSVFKYLSVVRVSVEDGDEIDEETGEIIPAFQKKRPAERTDLRTSSGGTRGKVKKKGRGY